MEPNPSLMSFSNQSTHSLSLLKQHTSLNPTPFNILLHSYQTMSEREDSDSDAPEEFTSEQGFKVDELIRKVQKENKDRVVREGKERRKQWAERKTPRPSKESENVKEVLEESETEKETPGTDVMHTESTPSTNGMLPENIVQMLAAREKKVFASDSEDEKTEEKPCSRKKKLKTAGIETIVLNGPKSEKLAQNSLEFLKKKRMEVPRSSSILKHKNQTRLLPTSDFLIKK